MEQHPLNESAALAAFAARDRAADGRFVAAVATTRIYCKASCPARRPRPEHVAIYPDAAAARADGYRACRRCRPDEVARDRAAVTRVAALMRQAQAAGESGPALAGLAAAAGYSPHHLLRLFRRATGVTPAAYARGLKAQAAGAALLDEPRVSEAIYAAGYAAPSRFYAGAAPRLGMAPGAWAKGGAGATIRWTVAATSLGPLLIAATEKGLCRVAFDEDGEALAARFPQAEVVEGGEALADLAARVVVAVETPGRDPGLPLDVRGTAFQEAVWQALRTIPPGETLSYADLAALAGSPGGSRAAGSACGANPVAVVVPCHRVTRRDGGTGGYAWGVERKAELLRRERGGTG